MNSTSPFLHNSIAPSSFIAPLNSTMTRTNLVTSLHEGAISAQRRPTIDKVRRLFNDSSFNNIPRSKRFAFSRSNPTKVTNSTKKSCGVINHVELSLPKSSNPNDYPVDDASQVLKSNGFYPGIFIDIKGEIDQILEELQCSQTDKQWEGLAKALEDLNQYKYKASLDYNIWEDSFKNIFKAVSNTKIKTKSQFDVFDNWVKLIVDDTQIGLQKNPSQAKVYLSRLHEALISPNEKIQEGVADSSNTLFNYGFFKKLSGFEYEELKTKLTDVIQATFNECEKYGERGYYYFIRNMLFSYKGMIESIEKFAFKEEVLVILKDQFKIFYQQTKLTPEQQTIVRQLSYLAFTPVQKQSVSLSEFCQKFTVKDMYPYEEMISIENIEVSIYSALPLNEGLSASILQDLKQVNLSFKTKFKNLMDTEKHKVNYFVAKDKASYEIFNYLLLTTATNNGGVLNYFTPPIMNGGELDYASPPSITAYKVDGIILNSRHELFHALFDFFVNFRQDRFNDLLYNLDWLNEALSYVLDPNNPKKNDGKRYLTRNIFPKIEKITKALNQDYTISCIFTEYLLEEKKPILDNILTYIKNGESSSLKNALENLSSLESKFSDYLKRRWSLQETMISTEDGVKYDVKIKIDQILKELQVSQTDKQWEDLAKAFKDLNRYKYLNDIDYNALKDSFKNIFKAISNAKIKTKSQFDVFKNWIELISYEDIPISLQKNPDQAKPYLSQLHEILTSSNQEIQENIHDSAAILFYYGFFEKLPNSEYTELRETLADVIQETFKQCENFGGRQYYYFIKEMLFSYEKLIQAIKKSAFKEEVLDMLKHQFETFYQRTKLTAEQQTTVKQLSYVILTSAQKQNSPLSEFCQRFTFKDMYPYQEEVSIENVEVSIYSALPLKLGRSEILESFKQAKLHFKTAFESVIDVKNNYKVNLLIAANKDSYETYNRGLLISTGDASSLNGLELPTITVYKMGNKIFNLEHRIKCLLFDLDVAFRDPKGKYGEYNFMWWNKGLFEVLIPQRSLIESELLAKLESKGLPNIEKITKGISQDYEFSFALADYLTEKHKSIISNIFLYKKTGQKDSLIQEIKKLALLQTDFHAFWNTRLENYRLKKLEVQRLQNQLLEAQQLQNQLIKSHQEESQRVETQRVEAYRLQNQQLSKQQREALMLKVQRLETQQQEIEQRRIQLQEDYQVKIQRLQDQLRKYQPAKQIIEQRLTTEYVATINTEKSKTKHGGLIPSKSRNAVKKIATNPSQSQPTTEYVATINTEKSEIKYEGWTPSKGRDAVKKIAYISTGVFYTTLATFLGITFCASKEKVRRRTAHTSRGSSRKKYPEESLEKQQCLLSAKKISRLTMSKKDFHKKDTCSSQRPGSTRV